MHSAAIHFWDDAGRSPSVPHVPRLLLVSVFALTLGTRLANWLLAPLHTLGILKESSHQYHPDELLSLWPITPFNATATHNSLPVPYNSSLIFSSSLSAIDSPLHIIRENLAPVIEYGSLGADRQEDITCAVCLTDFRATDRIRRLAICGHVFHMGCLDKWINYQRYTCPLCRSLTL